jgi:galactokinase
MTGAGFGGCAVALVKAESVAAFCDAVLAAYTSKVDLPAALYPCRPEAGARLVD